MLTVLGFDPYNNAREIELEGGKEEVQRTLEDAGWTNLVIIEAALNNKNHRKEDGNERVKNIRESL